MHARGLLLEFTSMGCDTRKGESDELDVYIYLICNSSRITRRCVFSCPICGFFKEAYKLAYRDKASVLRSFLRRG
jgi:hypothetical protein